MILPALAPWQTADVRGMPCEPLAMVAFPQQPQLRPMLWNVCALTLVPNTAQAYCTGHFGF
jgi:hypothetical protein